MKTIKLPIHNIVVELDSKSGNIFSDLKEECPGCGKEDCYICYTESNEDRATRKLFNTAMDAIKSIILSHAVAGIDIESPTYLEGLEAAINACSNNTK